MINLLITILAITGAVCWLAFIAAVLYIWISK